MPIQNERNGEAEKSLSRRMIAHGVELLVNGDALYSGRVEFGRVTDDLLLEQSREREGVGRERALSGGVDECGEVATFTVERDDGTALRRAGIDTVILSECGDLQVPRPMECQQPFN